MLNYLLSRRTEMLNPCVVGIGGPFVRRSALFADSFWTVDESHCSGCGGCENAARGVSVIELQAKMGKWGRLDGCFFSTWLFLSGYGGGDCGSLTEWWYYSDEKLRKMCELDRSGGSRLANCMVFWDIGGDAGAVLMRSCRPS